MPPTPDPEPARSRLPVAGLVAACVAAGFLLRLGSRIALSTPDGVWFGDPDACFHMRRVFLLLARQGTLPEFDAWTDFPDGCVPYVAPLLDWIVYGLCRLGGLTAADEAAVGRCAAFVPAALGALTAVPVYAIARRLFGTTAGVIAAAALAALPGHVLYTRFAMVDHHVLEALFLATLVAWSLPRAAAPAGTARMDWLRAGGGALCLLGLTLAWNGFALYLIVFAGVSALAPWRLAEPFRAHAPRFALRVFALYAPLLAGVVGSGYWFRHGDVRYDAPSLFHLALTGACALWCLASLRIHGARPVAAEEEPGAAGDRGPLAWFDRRPWARAGGVLAAGGGLAALAWAIPGPLGEAFVAMFGFPGISVNRFNLEGRPVWTHTEWIFDHLSGVSFLYPLAAFAICTVAEDDDRDVEGVWSLTGWGLAFFVLTIWMTRFTYVYAPFLAAMIGGIAWASGRAASSLHRSMDHPHARVGMALLVAFFCLLPALPTTRALARGGMEPGVERQRLLASLRAVTRDPGDWTRPEDRPAYAILCPWGIGHLVKFWARRPTVSDNMGVGFEKEFRWLFETDGERAYALLRGLGVGYVIVSHDQHLVQSYVETVHGPGGGPRFAERDENGDWKAADSYWDRVSIRLVSQDGAAWKAEEDEGGLAHFRLVAEGPKPENGKSSRAEMKCYEVVEGARLRGRAGPRDRVTARITMRVEGGREFLFESLARCDEAGRFELVVPYPTTAGDGPVRAAGAYRVFVAERTAEADVTEAEVRGGGTVEVVFPD